MKKLLVLLLLIIYIFSSCKEKYKYTITIPWEGGSFYYKTDYFTIDTETKCAKFKDNCMGEGNHIHTLCGTYQITQNY